MIAVIRQFLVSASSAQSNPSSQLSNGQLSLSSKSPLSAREDSVEKQQRLRGLSVQEFKDSETKYYTQLKTLLVELIDPLKTEGDINILKDTSVAVLFGTIVPITNLTKEILTKLTTDESENRIGKIFCEIAPVFKMYQDYINHYERCSDKILEYRKENAKFDEKIKKFEKSAETQSVTFFLILPVQRLPRYEMLLSTVLKYTPPNFDDYPHLKTAEDKIKQINQTINKRKEEDRNRSRVVDIQNSMITTPREADFKNFIESSTKIILNSQNLPEMPSLLSTVGRSFVREGAMVEYCELATNLMDSSSSKKKEILKHAKPFYFFMFNDILVKSTVKNIAKISLNANSNAKNYRFVEMLDFKKISIVEIPGKEEDVEYLFKIREEEPVVKELGKRMHVLSCLDEEERNDWVRDLKTAIDANKLKR